MYLSSECHRQKHSTGQAGDADGVGGEDVRFRCTLSGLRLEATAELRWGLGRRHSVRTACAAWPQLPQGRGRENSAAAAARKTNTFSEPEPETFHVSDKQQFRPRMSGPDARIVREGFCDYFKVAGLHCPAKAVPHCHTEWGCLSASWDTVETTTHIAGANNNFLYWIHNAEE